MSGECNWCGGPHAEGGCKADRELIYSNGMAAGYANGHNDQNPILNTLRTENAALRERLRLAVEARKAWAEVEDNDIDTFSERYTKAIAADNALRAAGVDI